MSVSMLSRPITNRACIASGKYYDTGKGFQTRVTFIKLGGLAGIINI